MPFLATRKVSPPSTAFMTAAELFRNSRWLIVFICEVWALQFAHESGGRNRLGDFPARVDAGTINDPAERTLREVALVAVGYADNSRPPLLGLGEAKWNETMGVGHLDRLRSIRELVSKGGRYDTSATRLLCFSGVGFSPGLQEAQGRGEVELVGLDELYGTSSSG